MAVIERRVQSLQSEKAELAGTLEQVTQSNIIDEPEQSTLTLALDLVIFLSLLFVNPTFTAYFIILLHLFRFIWPKLSRITPRST